MIFGLSVAINLLVGLALGLNLPVAASVLVFVAVTLGAPLPSLPLRLGVFEALCWLALSNYQIPLDTAVSYGILLHVVAFVWPVVGGFMVLVLTGSGTTPVHGRRET